MFRMVGILLWFSALAAGQQNSLLDGLANLSDAVSKRVSSADRSGGNADWVEVKAKSTVTLADQLVSTVRVDESRRDGR